LIGHFNENLREWLAIRHDLRNSAERNLMEGANTGSEPLMMLPLPLICKKKRASDIVDIRGALL
jgi:hypothetical protein